MNKEGPSLALLTRHLSEAPPEVTGNAGAPIVAAVVSDALRDLGGPNLTAREAAAMTPSAAGAPSANRRRWLLIGAWLLRCEALRELGGESGATGRARDWLAQDAKALAAVLDARQVLADPDRREEIARRALAALDLRPLGESKAQAEDRLRSLDSIERQRVILETRAAQERARQIREEMARKAAEEAAAARYGRE